MIELLTQLKIALAKLTLLLVGLGSVATPVGTPVLGGVTKPITDPTPVVSKLDRFEVPFSEKVQNEGKTKVEMLKDRPKMILSKWNGEVQMGVEYKKVTANAQKLVSSNEVKWGTGNEIVHAYKKDADNFEIEIELKAKPTTNKFDFTIDGADQLDFFYQAPLWQEAGLKTPTADCSDTVCSIGSEGTSTRPENVVGSYAVYYRDHANHQIGSTNYATGKAYHIYRPKIIDANGAWTWGILDYKNGILSVEVPQKFLDEAVYPVKVDPTIGYAIQGGTKFNPGADTIFASNVTTTISSTGIASSVIAYVGCDLSCPREWKGALYLSTSTLVSPQAGTSTQTGTGSWQTASFSGSGPTLSVGNDYLPAAFLDWNGSPSNAIWRDATKAGDTKTQAIVYGSWPNPASWSNSSNAYSIYATYTASGGATAPTRRRSIIINDN